MIDTGQTFSLHSDFVPTGDQPAAIEALLQGLQTGQRHQVLEGVTGSGKTFTMANVIARAGKPTLVMSHNKTLAAQLYAELKAFLPHNAVSYFVSYFDYYQPEAYIPRTDTFIEKDSSINEDIERLRLEATDNLLNRRDTVVASVSCIYGLGSPEDYKAMLVRLEPGMTCDRDEFLAALVASQYTRNEAERAKGTFRVRGDTVELYPAYREDGYRIQFFGDEVETLQVIDPLTGKVDEELDEMLVSPAKHFVTPEVKLAPALIAIRSEMEERVKWFEKQGKLLEAQRIRMRTEYDLEILSEIGFCSGIENYSRYLTGRKPGERPYTLLDFFPDDFLTIIDESHVSVPQVRGMYNGDVARKSVLVDHGFRLPSALDNRPLNFEEFMEVVGPLVYVSATPNSYELDLAGEPVRQMIRPTEILDPDIEIRPLDNQIDDLIHEVRERAERNERVLVTTLTKKISEDLTTYLENIDLRVKYLHSDIDAIERVEILRALRRNEFDCLIGINLLREGLDLPEVTLVAILDADKEGFLRSSTSLIQTAGRAARNRDGKVILYADNLTDSIKELLRVTSERREVQAAYNQEHGITPRTVIREVPGSLAVREESDEVTGEGREGSSSAGVEQLVQELEAEMEEAAGRLEFERAALLRDQVMELRATMGGASGSRSSSSSKGRQGRKGVHKGATYKVKRKGRR